MQTINPGLVRAFCPQRTITFTGISKKWAQTQRQLQLARTPGAHAGWLICTASAHASLALRKVAEGIEPLKGGQRRFAYERDSAGSLQ